MQQCPGLVLMIVKMAQSQSHLKLFLSPDSQSAFWTNVHIFEIMTLVLKKQFWVQWYYLSVNKCMVEVHYEHVLDQSNGKNIFKHKKKKKKETIQIMQTICEA